MKATMFALHDIDKASFVARHGEKAASDFEEYGVWPSTEAEKEAGRKGWTLRLIVQNNQGGMRCFQFESLDIQNSSRCLREVWAHTEEEAVQKLSPPVW